MLEGILEQLLLTRLRLGDWIEGLDRSKLKIEIWSGVISLKNLTLKSSAFIQFDLPFTVKYGHIEELNINIPWSSLQSQSVRVTVRGVYLLLETKDGTNEMAELSSGALEAQQHRTHITEAEQLRQWTKTSSTKAEAESGFVESMMSTILANLSVTIEKVHVRIEHPAPIQSNPTAAPIASPQEEESKEESESSSSVAAASSPTLSFAAGLTISSLTVFTTDPNGVPSFIVDSKKEKIRKSIKLEDVAMYCNPLARSWCNLPPAALRISLSNNIARIRKLDEIWWKNNELKNPKHRFSFLLLPLNLSIHVKMNRKEMMRKAESESKEIGKEKVLEPYINLTLNMPVLPLSLTNVQLKSLAQFAESLSSKRIRARTELEMVIQQCQNIKPTRPPMSLIEDDGAAEEVEEKKDDVQNEEMKSPEVITHVPSSNCKAWWNYTTRCIILLANVHRQNRRAFTSSAFKVTDSGIPGLSTKLEGGHLTLLDRAKLFKAYIPLYKRSLGASWLTELSESESRTLASLENLLDVKDIMFYRDLADKELELEAGNRERMLELERVANSQRGFVASWYGYLSGSDAATSVKGKKIDASKSSASSSSSSSSKDGIELTAEQKQAVLEMLGTSATVAASSSSSPAIPHTPISKQYVLYKFALTIDEVTMDLIEVSLPSPSSNSNDQPLIGNSHPLARLHLTRFTSTVSVKPIDPGSAGKGKGESVHPAIVSMSLESFGFEDCISRGSIYPLIASSSSPLDSLGDGLGLISSASAVAKIEPFFNLDYLRVPDDGKADHRITMQMKGIVLNVSPYFITRLIRFLPALQSEESGAIEQTNNTDMSASVSSSTSAALANLASTVTQDMQHEFVSSLARRTKWDITLSFDQLRILIPEHCCAQDSDADAKRALTTPVLVFSMKQVIVRSHVPGSDSTSASSSSSSSPTSTPNLPAVLTDHPTAFDQFSLSIDTIQLRLWATKELFELHSSSASSISSREPTPQESFAPTPESRFILMPLSLQLSLFVCVRTVRDERGVKLPLPRSLLTGLLPRINLQLTQSSFSFGRKFIKHASKVINQAWSDELGGINPAGTGATPTVGASVDADSTWYFNPFKPLKYLGWIQLINVQCSSLSLIFLNDLGFEVESANIDADDRLSFLRGNLGVGSVPVCHVCFVDCDINWSHPRAVIQSSNSVSTEIMATTIKATLNVTAYDSANVEWIQVMDQCPYEVRVEWQTQTTFPDARRPERVYDVVNPPVKQCISIHLQANAAQEVHISDRLLAALLQLYQTFEKRRELKKEKANHTSSSSSSSSSSISIAPSTVSPHSFSPFLFKNTTRSQIRCQIRTKSNSSAPSVGSGSHQETVIEPGEECIPVFDRFDPVSPKSVSLGSHVSTFGQAWTFCDFEFGPNLISVQESKEANEVSIRHPPSPFKSLINIPVSKVGTLVYELMDATSGSPTGSYVQIVVSLHNATKRIELKSLHTFTNSTNLPLELRLLPLEDPTLPPSIPAWSCGSVDPGQTISLPIDEPPRFSWQSIQFRPLGFGMEWNSGGQIVREAISKQERSIIVAVCKLEGLEETTSDAPVPEEQKFDGPTSPMSSSTLLPPGGLGVQAPAFVAHVVARTTKHMANVLLPPADRAQDIEGIMSYHRIHFEVFPPLNLTNLFLFDMSYQLKYRAVGAELLTAGLLHPGDKIWLHDVEFSKFPLIRFHLLPSSSTKQLWSEWIGMEQVTGKPIVEYLVQIQQSNQDPPVPLLTQIHRSLSSHSGSINLTFMCPYWLNNQSGLALSYTQADELYENERFIFFKWRSPSLPTDRPQWSDRSGNPTQLQLPHLSGVSVASPVASSPNSASASSSDVSRVVATSKEFTWLDESNWAVEIITPTQTDQQGWQYALDFPGPYHAANSALDAVRRRKWFRHRALRPLIASQASSSSSMISPNQFKDPFHSVRMLGAPINSSPAFSIYATRSVMPPSHPIDLSRAATDSIVLLATPRSHRAPGNAVQSYELAVLVDNGPPPFHNIKIFSFHARYQIHNETNMKLHLRQVGLDQRNGKFIEEIQPGSTQPFHPWICTPPILPNNVKPPPTKFGLHLTSPNGSGSGESFWSPPFPIQRIGEFTVKFERTGLISASDSMKRETVFLRVKVELKRTILHVHIMNELTFCTLPSALPSPFVTSKTLAVSPTSPPSQPSPVMQTGSLYRIDNHTIHPLFIQQLPPGATPYKSIQRSSTATSIPDHSSSIYAFDYFDLNVGSGNQPNEPDSLMKPPSQTICIEIEPLVTELEQLQQIEREFNGLPVSKNEPGQTLWTSIGFDEVGAESYVKLPNTFTVVAPPTPTTASSSSPLSISTKLPAPFVASSSSSVSDQYAAVVQRPPAAILQCRALHFRVVTDGPTRVLVVNEIDLQDSESDGNEAEDELEYRVARKKFRSQQEPDAAEDLEPSVPTMIITCTMVMKEINIILFEVGEFGSNVRRPATVAAPTLNRTNSTSAVSKVVRKGMALTQKWRGIGATKSASASVDATAQNSSHIKEILFIQFLGFSIDGTWTPTVTNVQLKLQRFQVDNPMTNPIYPVVMHSMHEQPLTTASDPAANRFQRPALLLFLSVPKQPKRISSKSSIPPLYIDRFYVLLNPFRVSLDEDLMRSVAAFKGNLLNRYRSGAARALSPALKRQLSLQDRSRAQSSADTSQLITFLLASDSISPSPQRQQAYDQERMFYFRELLIESLNFHISYTPLPFISTPAVPIDPLKSFHRTLGSMKPFLDCEDARIQFNSLERQKLFTSLTKLNAELNKVYTAELMSQSLELLGRAKAFGNPMGVLNAVQIGWRDLVDDPSLSRGAKSFLSQTAAGMSGGTAGLTNSISSRVAKLSSDPNYLSQRATHLAHDRPQTGREGLSSAAKHFGAGWIDGFTGLVAHPVAGAKESGLTGGLKGVGRGLVGLLVKPIAGTLDAVSKVSEGVRAENNASAAANSNQTRQSGGGSGPSLAINNQKISRPDSIAYLTATHSNQATVLNGPASTPPSSASSSSSTSPPSFGSLMWRCSSCSCFNANSSNRCLMCGATNAASN